DIQCQCTDRIIRLCFHQKTCSLKPQIQTTKTKFLLKSKGIRVMPLDLPMHTRLSRHASMDNLLGLSTLRSHRSVSRPSTYDSLRPKSPRSPQTPASPVSTLNFTSSWGTLKKKKRVVFADDKGLPLTAVRIFESDPPISDVEELSPHFTIQTESSVQNKKPRLCLGFPQPSADLSSFHESLTKSLVRLESCTLIYGSLFGKVRVCNISTEKAVHIRITHDSWRSQQDIPCTPIQEKNLNSETEVFIFNVPVPFYPNAEDRLEFYVTYRLGSGNTLLFDTNGGQNYRILVEDMDSEEVKQLCMNFAISRHQEGAKKSDKQTDTHVRASSLHSSMPIVMPVDLAMHMGLNRKPAVGQLLGSSTLRAHHAVSRPSMCDSQRPRPPRSPQIPTSPLNSTSPCGILKKKKRVVFADAKGLSLTAVHIFKSDPPISDMGELSPPVRMQTESSAQGKQLHLRLGFPQPADLPSYFEGLTKSLVHLESCTLIYGSLLGKVRVCNISHEKAVHVRITYDSWRSHQDILCMPIKENKGNSETELFVFNVPIPFCPSVQDRLEFCVSFRPGSGNINLWDNNGGQNYRILVEDMDSEEAYMVEKKPLRPQNFQNPQTLPLRNGPVLYKSANYGSHISSENTSKILSRRENIISKNTFIPNSNIAKTLH
ncbi:hypothetical protein QTP86_023340, partial [Hemibagrus guttatus]